MWQGKLLLNTFSQWRETWSVLETYWVRSGGEVAQGKFALSLRLLYMLYG